MITDLRNDMKAECEKFGEVRKVIVFDVSIKRIPFTFFFFIHERLIQIKATNWYRNERKRNMHRNIPFIT